MRTSGLPLSSSSFRLDRRRRQPIAKIGQCFPLHQTRRSFRATPGTFCWSMWMTNDFKIEFLIFLLQSFFQWKPSLNGLTTIFTFSLSRSFLENLKHYPFPISSRALHALYTIPWRSRLTKTNAQPLQTMSVTIHEKRLFPSLIFWHLYASTFFLFSVFIDLFY